MMGEKCLFCQIFKLKGKGHKPSGAEMKILQLKLLLKLLLKPAQLELITTNFCFSAVVYRLNSYSEGSVLMNVFQLVFLAGTIDGLVHIDILKGTLVSRCHLLDSNLSYFLLPPLSELRKENIAKCQQSISIELSRPRTNSSKSQRLTYDITYF